MKKIFSCILFIFFFQNLTFSQVDVKGGMELSIPFGLTVAGEYLFRDDIGFELGLVPNTGMLVGETYFAGKSLLLNGRYYFRPREGNDRFYIGAYLRLYSMMMKREFFGFGFTPSSIPVFEETRQSGLGIGFLIGRKLVNRKSFFVEANVGIGRSFSKKARSVEVPSFGSGGLTFDAFLSIRLGFRIDEIISF